MAESRQKTARNRRRELYRSIRAHFVRVPIFDGHRSKPKIPTACCLTPRETGATAPTLIKNTQACSALRYRLRVKSLNGIFLLFHAAWYNDEAYVYIFAGIEWNTVPTVRMSSTQPHLAMTAVFQFWKTQYSRWNWFQWWVNKLVVLTLSSTLQPAPRCYCEGIMKSSPAVFLPLCLRCIIPQGWLKVKIHPAPRSFRFEGDSSSHCLTLLETTKSTKPSWLG